MYTQTLIMPSAGYKLLYLRLGQSCLGCPQHEAVYMMASSEACYAAKRMQGHPADASGSFSDFPRKVAHALLGLQ